MPTRQALIISIVVMLPLTPLSEAAEPKPAAVGKPTIIADDHGRRDSGRLAKAQNATVPVTVTLTTKGKKTDADLAPQFLGLSYETSMLLPKDGHYYFDAHDPALVQIFKTLGIKSLRVGANAVDHPSIPIPREKDIAALFSFARAADVKVIYSFRLKEGNPADSAHLAAYIAAHYADALDSFSIGNEPNSYLKSYASFLAQWKPHYEAILKAVPTAKFDGPSCVHSDYARNLAKDMSAQGHLAMASNHYYFLGHGRNGEKNPAANRARFLSNRLHQKYEKAYAEDGAVLAAERVPYRIDETNSCYMGGAKGSSDTYASTLWALDYTHWWAAHHILGMNYHTGERVGRDGKFGAPNYAVFLREANGRGFAVRPQAYALLAFTQGAHGRPLGVNVEKKRAFDFIAYAYQDHHARIYVTLINKSYGDKAQSASVSLHGIRDAHSGTWQRMDLVAKNQDVSAAAGITLGGGAIDAQGTWPGRWDKMEAAGSRDPAIQVPAASATILVFSPGK